MRQCAVRVIQLIGILEHPASRWLKHRIPLLWWTTVVGTYQHGHLDEKKAVIGYLHVDPYGMETASLLHGLAHSVGLYIPAQDCFSKVLELVKEVSSSEFLWHKYVV